MFSLKNDQAWASWPTAGFHLSLGPVDDVAEMMKDFVAQIELGKRLEAQRDNQEEKAAGKFSHVEKPFEAR